MVLSIQEKHTCVTEIGLVGWGEGVHFLPPPYLVLFILSDATNAQTPRRGDIKGTWIILNRPAY